MAVTTATARCVNVAQPKPYKPGSFVSTFTTTRLMPSGAVAIAFTLLIFTGGIPLLLYTDAFFFVCAAAKGLSNSPSRPAVEPNAIIFIACRRGRNSLVLFFMIQLFVLIKVDHFIVLKPR